MKGGISCCSVYCSKYIANYKMKSQQYSTKAPRFMLTKENKSNIDIGFEATLKFDEEIVKYSYMWKKGGEYSK